MGRKSISTYKLNKIKSLLSEGKKCRTIRINDFFEIYLADRQGVT